MRRREIDAKLAEAMRQPRHAASLWVDFGLWRPHLHRNYGNLHLFEWGWWMLSWDFAMRQRIG